MNANGNVRHLQPPDYHGNPVDEKGSLVTFWWGYDLANRIDKVLPSTRSSGFWKTVHAE